MKSSLTRLLLAISTLAPLSPAAATAQPTPRPNFPFQSTAHDGVITTEPYDEGDKPRRLITLQPMFFEQTPERQASFSITYSYTTNPYAFDGGVRILFLSRGPQCRFSPNTSVLITRANGIPVTLDYRPPTGHGVNWVHSEVGEDGVCVESLVTTLLPKTFSMISEGYPSAVQIGTARFLFDANKVNAMRAFERMVARAPN